MSAENLEAAKAGIDAVNRRDIDALLRFCDPEIEFHAYFSDVLGGTFTGHSGMQAYMREITENFEEFVIEIEWTEDRGELVIGHAKAHGRSVSGVEAKWQATIATRFRDGKVWRMASRPTESEALEAVRLSD